MLTNLKTSLFTTMYNAQCTYLVRPKSSYNRKKTVSTKLDWSQPMEPAASGRVSLQKNKKYTICESALTDGPEIWKYNELPLKLLLHSIWNYTGRKTHGVKNSELYSSGKRERKCLYGCRLFHLFAPYSSIT